MPYSSIAFNIVFISVLHMVLELEECESKINSFVESRMVLIAPNLSVLVGAPVAAKLLSKLRFRAHVLLILTQSDHCS